MSGTYEVYIDVRHHQRHLDDCEKHESTAFKLVDTGKPRQMVLDALRSFADALEERWAREDAAAVVVRARDDAKARWEERRAS